jgi:group I intron endonuclease
MALTTSGHEYYIDLLQPLGSNGYNSSPTAGSTLGIKRPPFSVQWRENMSSARLGERNHFYGRTHNDNTRRIIADKAKARMADPTVNYFYGKRFTGEANWMFGKTHSPEAKAKIAAASKGRKHSENSKRRMSEYRKGRPLVKNRKAVIQLDREGNQLAVFSSLTEAAQSVGVSIQSIQSVTSGRGKTSKGFIWRYAK